jgi:hypothetical protein
MTYYAVVSALIFAVVAVGHVIRILNRWAVTSGLSRCRCPYRGLAL